MKQTISIIVMALSIILLNIIIFQMNERISQLEQVLIIIDSGICESN